MNKFEIQQNNPQKPEVPNEVTEYIDVCKKMSDRGVQAVEMHLMRIQELAESLYKHDENFKAIVDEEMKGVTDREFEPEGEEENNKDHLQAYLNAMATYSKEFESAE